MPPIDIRALLPRDNVLLHLEGDSQRDILCALAAPLLRQGVILDLDAFVADLHAREADVTTQVPGGIAFPHARSSVVTRLGLVLGVADEPGLSFSEDISEPCRLFFLMSVPSVAPTAHLPLLRFLSAFARTPQKVGRLLGAATPARALKVLATFKHG